MKTREWYLLPLERRQELMDGHIRIGTDRRRDGETLDGVVDLGGWEGLVAEIR